MLNQALVIDNITDSSKTNEHINKLFAGSPFIKKTSCNTKNIISKVIIINPIISFFIFNLPLVYSVNFHGFTFIPNSVNVANTASFSCSLLNPTIRLGGVGSS